MRAVPPALAAALDSGAATLARCWRLVRADGAEVRATEHDRPLVIAGQHYEPAAAFHAGQLDTGASAPARTSLDGTVSTGITIPGIEDEDLLLGRWDRAEVSLLVADWTAPSISMLVWTMRIGRITRRGAAFELELEGLEAALDVPVTRVFQRRCDAVLGDARCGVNMDAPAYRQAGTLVEAPDDRTLIVEATSLDLSALAGGSVRFEAGALTGTDWPVAKATPAAAGVMLDLATALPLRPQAGDSVRLSVGCDHSFATLHWPVRKWPAVSGLPADAGR